MFGTFIFRAETAAKNEALKRMIARGQDPESYRYTPAVYN